MKRISVLLILVGLFLALVLSPRPASADSSHARIVRLSLIQGDVRFARQFHDDSLTDSKAVWETAPLNLPLREGYALATGSGRAEIEFENGAMAFLGDNTVVEFYDLSLHDGGRISRLILRQGSGVFYVNPSVGDYFSVTGGDFAVEATARTTFRLDNFDDGSTVSVDRGQVTVLRNDKSTPLQKGQALSVNVGQNSDVQVARASDPDDFDHWVSGRIDSVVTATNYSTQYVNSPNYSAGFADLYTYGSWFSLAGYGYGWRPFGVGMGWSPFDYGNWYFDQGLGWSFMGSAPWGWLPYHYGGWVFSPGYGWLWTPVGFGSGRPIIYRPVTAVWVRSGATMGLVPAHPADVRGKAPLNLTQGIYQLQGNALGKTLVPGSPANWAVVKQAPRDTLSNTLAKASSPAPVSRTILSSNSGPRSVTLSRQSSIAYDPVERRFVNASNAPSAAANLATTQRNEGTATNTAAQRPAASMAKTPSRPTTTAAFPRSVPSRPALTPPSPHSSGGSSSAGTAFWGGGSSSSASSSRASSSSSHASTGGGRPH